MPPVPVPVKATFSGIWPEVGMADAVAASGLPTALTVMVTIGGGRLGRRGAVGDRQRRGVGPGGAVGVAGVLGRARGRPVAEVPAIGVGGRAALAEPVKDTFSGALPVVGVPDAVAESGVGALDPEVLERVAEGGLVRRSSSGTSTGRGCRWGR